MSMYHRFYIKQINPELEVVQPIYVQKTTNFGHVGLLLKMWICSIRTSLMFVHLNNELWAYMAVRH